MIDRVHVIHNLFKQDEIQLLTEFQKNCRWLLEGYSSSTESKSFWYMDLYSSPANKLFTDKIQRSIGKKIIINELYVNGQSHGQCGEWHIDQKPGAPHNDYTIVYFLNKWHPLYGGHLLIDIGEIVSILPEFNMGVLFNSSERHVGLEPTIHCKTQRESIACKFRIIDE